MTSRKTVNPGSAPNTPPRRTGGFTLMELMVSISIMSVIMLAFGGLLTQANQVVTDGERRMRSDAAASAISRIIRKDIRQATKNGFLRLGKNVFVIVTAGQTESSFSNVTGDGSVVIYGWDENSNVLYRKVLVLSKNAPVDSNPDDGNDEEIVDCLVWNDGTGKRGMNLAELQVLSDAKMGELIDYMVKPPDNMRYPPNTLLQVTKTSWMVLAGGCTGLQIAHQAPGESDWKEGSPATYTRHNQTSWPTAIKFRFTLQPKSIVGAVIADDGGAAEYEIICPIGH
ncbi:MAG: prepilin-type N-terminal cleavage/methylation domain-containing protein [Phycisphaerales bacterium]|nr:prepilin-type N-terminal cleavage/methylation domain-containing protein [Phycisphaerales bacterium]